MRRIWQRQKTTLVILYCKGLEREKIMRSFNKAANTFKSLNITTRITYKSKKLEPYFDTKDDADVNLKHNKLWNAPECTHENIWDYRNLSTSTHVNTTGHIMCTAADFNILTSTNRQSAVYKNNLESMYSKRLQPTINKCEAFIFLKLFNGACC